MVMEHQYLIYSCSLCKEIPDVSPLIYCPFKHQYCLKCFNQIQQSYPEVDQDHQEAYCPACRGNSSFRVNPVTTDFLKSIKLDIKKENSLIKEEPSTCYSDDCLSHRYNNNDHHQYGDYTDSIIECTLSMDLLKNQISKKPVICFHNNCNKHVAISKLFLHYKYEHGDVARLSWEKNSMFKINFDVSNIEYGKTSCLALLTIFENSKINVEHSKSSTSVLKTCDKLSGRVSINTFWLMSTCSPEIALSNLYFWLYSNSNEEYLYKIELFSKNNYRKLSTICKTINLHEIENIGQIETTINCLYVSRGSLQALLMEDDEIVLGVTVQ